MRIGRTVLLGGMIASTLALTGCYNDRPGYWGDHRGRHHHHHRGHDRWDGHDRGDHHDGHHDGYRGRH